METIFHSVTVWLLTTLLLVAAEPRAWGQQVRGGVRAGASVGAGVGADARQSKWLMGYHAGFLGQVSFAPHWSLQPEVLYHLKGDRSTDYGPSIQASLGYLELPLLARYTLHDAFLEAGAYGSRLLTRRYHSPDLQELSFNPYQPLDYGLVAGFGYQDPHGLSLSWRYTAGLRNVYRPVDFSGELERVRLRHGTLQFTFGYLLPWSWGTVR